MDADVLQGDACRQIHGGKAEGARAHKAGSSMYLSNML